MTAVIQDAAASALGKQFIRLARQHGITLINIVRKEEQITLLKKEENAEHVLNSESPTFVEDLKALIATVNPKFYFSAIGGGKVPETIFAKMPKESTVFIYGLLGGEPFSFMNWIFQ